MVVSAGRQGWGRGLAVRLSFSTVQISKTRLTGLQDQRYLPYLGVDRLLLDDECSFDASASRQFAGSTGTFARSVHSLQSR